MTDTAEFTSWNELVKEYKYKPGFLIGHVYKIDFDEHWLILEMRVPDVYNPERLTTVSMQYRVEKFDHIGEKVALAMVRECIRELEMHEIDEWIMVRGEKIYDPHKEK